MEREVQCAIVRHLLLLMVRRDNLRVPYVQNVNQKDASVSKESGRRHS